LNTNNPDDMGELHYLIAILERVLAYAYSGSAKVLPRKLMGAFWITHALSLTGCPSINPRILEFLSSSASEGRTFNLNTKAWPVTTSPYKPLLASTRALELTYDPTFQQVSQCSLNCSACPLLRCHPTSHADLVTIDRPTRPKRPLMRKHRYHVLADDVARCTGYATLAKT
jgi:hypothetical protein